MRRRVFKFDERTYNSSRQTYYRTQVVPQANQDVKFSIVVPCFNTPTFYLEQLIDSVYAQKYANWELLLIDASNVDRISKQIQLSAQNDSRIVYLKVPNKGIAANTNAGIEAASGDYICFLDHDDLLDPGALAEVALIIDKHPQAELIYSDEDKIDDPGENYSNPHYKPDFSIDLLRNVNYITHFVVVRGELVKEIKGLRLGFDGAQDYDFLLRVVDKTQHIFHVPKVLYHWRQAEGSTSKNFGLKKNVTVAGVRALNDHYARNGIKAKAYAINNRPGFYGAIYDLSSASRAIYVVLEDNELEKIRDYIISSYTKLTKGHIPAIDIYTVTRLEEINTERYDYILVVQGRIKPTHRDLSLNNLFGLVENGSRYAGIKLVTNNRIYDNGYVHDGNGYMPLFRGFDPMLPNHFGSTEWNRNVDGLTTLLVCLSTKDISKLKKTKFISSDKGDITLLGQFQYHIFSPLYSSPSDVKDRRYFNPNLINTNDPRTMIMDDITDYIKVKR